MGATKSCWVMYSPGQSTYYTRSLADSRAVCLERWKKCHDAPDVKDASPTEVRVQITQITEIKI